MGSGLVEDVADIFFLTEAQLQELDTFAERKSRSLLDAILVSKQRPLDRLLAAFGIRGVGAVAARALAERFGSLDALEGATPVDFGPNGSPPPKLNLDPWPGIPSFSLVSCLVGRVDRQVSLSRRMGAESVRA